MVQPNVESLAAEGGAALGVVASQTHLSGSVASSVSFEGEQEERRHQEESSTTDDCMSNADDDSDAHSMHSRQDIVESIPSLVHTSSRGGDTSSVSSEFGGAGSSNKSTIVGASPPSNDVDAGESAGLKRTISEEDRAAQGPLRKACDLCTKRKRKCNGQHPCSQCVETGARDQCVYSPRLKSGRKKKVRVDGVVYDEGGGLLNGPGSGLALVSNGGRRGSGMYAVDTAAGRFSPSGTIGLAGHVENFFLATYLRDFNRMIPLTSESSVTEGMLEVLSPAVSAQGLAAASPIKQPESRRQAKLAVFWGVVAMGSRILGANVESTARYLGLMRTSLRECFDCNDKEVVQAYLLLSTVETMRGNEEAGKRYLDHAHTMHNGNAMGAEGQLLADRPEQDECLDLVFQIYGQPDGCVRRHTSAAVGTAHTGDHRRRLNSSSSAVDQMIAQAMSPPSESQSGPLKALKYLSTACGLSSEVFDPTNKCVTVKQYLSEMDDALKGAHSLFKHSDLSECITGVVMVKIWGGVTVLMRSWGKPLDKEIGLSQVEEGVGYALTRPGLMTFPMWWHALHCAAVVLAHFGHGDTYMRLRATFNKNTFPGTEMPPIESYSPGAICPQLGGSCSKLAYWLQVRGTMCSEPGWQPQFNGRLSEESENAAYAAALDRNNVCVHQAKDNMEYTAALKRGQMNKCDGNKLSTTTSSSEGGEPVQREPSNERALRAALDAGLSEIGTQLSDMGDLDALNASEIDLDPLGVEFDLSQIQESEAVATTEMPTVSAAVVAEEVDTTMAPPALPVGRDTTPQAIVGEVVGGGELSRDLSFGIMGSAAASTAMMSGLSGMQQGEALLPRQSSLDINTIMQMVSSDEQLKKNNEDGQDAMDNALAFGEGPAKELFGVDLSTL